MYLVPLYRLNARCARSIEKVAIGVAPSANFNINILLHHESTPVDWAFTYLESLYSLNRKLGDHVTKLASEHRLLHTRVESTQTEELTNGSTGFARVFCSIWLG